MHSEISARILNIENSIKDIQSQIQNIVIPEAKDFDLTAYNELYIKKLNLEKEKTVFESQLKEYNKYISEKIKLENEIKNLEEQRDKIKLRRLSPIDITDESQEKLLQQISDLHSYLKTLNKNKSLIEQGKCENCGQDFHGDIQKTLLDIEETNKKILLLTEEYNSNKQRLATYNNDVQQQALLTLKKENIQSKINELNLQLEKLQNLECPVFLKEDEYNVVCKDFDTFTERKQEFDANQKEISQLTALKESLQDSIKLKQDLIIQLKAQQETLDITPRIKPDDFDEEYFNNLNNSLVLYDQRLKERERILEHNAKIKQQKMKDEQEILLKEQTIQELIFHVNILKDTLRIISKEFASFLIDEGAAYIKEQLNFFFQRVYNRYFIDFRKDKNSVDFLYSPDNKNFRSVGMASGFERVLLAMAFRVALMNMTGLGLLSLDEVDADADEDNSIELYQNLLQVPFNQMFCVTHRKSTVEFLENDYGAQIISL
jgi:chromosome segregation ATPase